MKNLESKANRVQYGETLIELGESDKNIVVVEADIGKSTNTLKFGKKFPERYFNIGVQEQNEISMSAGLAAMGKTVFASTFAIFLSMRACEQIRTNLGYTNLNVKVVASNAGVEIAGDGATHQAVEDIATMTVIPNLKVFSPSDAVITDKLIRTLAKDCGPAYVRLGRQSAPIIHDADVEFEIGKMIKMCEGRDCAIIATGHMVARALEARKILKEKGINCSVYDCHTIKPLDIETIKKAAKECRLIVTAEDHHKIGGLGSAVCNVIAENGLAAKVVKVGLDDIFPSSGRDFRRLMEHYHLDTQDIVKAVEKNAGFGKPIDVSVCLSNDMLIYEGDPAINIVELKSIAKGDLYNYSIISLGSHTGTHMDAPKHFLDTGKTVEELPLDYFIGECKVFDMGDIGKIDLNDVENLDICEGDIVLFKTTNSKLMRERRFLKDYVYITPLAASYLADKKIKSVGIDFLTVEQYKCESPDTHYAFLENDVVILEGLDLTDVCAGEYVISTAPVKIKGGNGSFMRCVLTER